MDYLGKHISGQYDADLAHIRREVMTMGGLVEQQFSHAIRTLLEHDVELAEQVIAGDQKVNQMEVAIDEACVKIIAKRQPTASDLRLIMVILKLIAELERIGDSAEAICRIAKQDFTPEQLSLLTSLETMGNSVMKMLKDVLDAFTRMDMDAALTIYLEDKRIAQKYDLVIRQMMTFMMEDPRSIPNILIALNCARSIMRVSSRCQNISELVFYFVKGQDYRHVGDDVIEKLLKERENPA
ncbi:phosphate signaling complex protein PhoU [Wohlfahrtiimonas chitiniclastica]|uniref:phosphate signaling complex protein PhoU n=1 Tax=Wohlfahrtiimonas chitiniclastica TaxID=400946 RepID=UPI0007B40874|nr:phosphate signaling complex protein PhoU [Wohlfahrtiimonas chitiniclastica]KZS23557.1 phosphate transport system regulatory protein PhoU [Wohlfahrtiimonas chitiniclastica]MDC7251979.1 phosphate transport system regulatory protein PhoU [Wohlfahrtiimonas chitiniclastica]WHR55954.1 phosphate signaling complex protein PhoU [Wohlfahrtiimonas chitiniclastica]